MSEIVMFIMLVIFYVICASIMLYIAWLNRNKQVKIPYTIASVFWYLCAIAYVIRLVNCI